ncbi:MAG: response regulator [Oscillospiraceae bacterium]
MNFAICDDTSIYLNQLQEMIQRYNPGTNEPVTVDTFTSGEELLAVFSKGKYDAIILDIDMKEINGVQAAHEIRKADKSVVIAFHTGYQSFPMHGYEIGSHLWMLKGQQDDIYETQFLKIFHECIYEKMRIQIDGRDVLLRSILFFQKKRKTVFMTAESGTTAVNCSLTSIEADKELCYFTKPHRRYYINSAHIKEVSKNKVIMKNGAVIPLGFKYRKSAKDDFMSFLMRNR